jgi:N-acetylgalactosamine kinase
MGYDGDGHEWIVEGAGVSPSSLLRIISPAIVAAAAVLGLHSFRRRKGRAGCDDDDSLLRNRSHVEDSKLKGDGASCSIPVLSRDQRSVEVASHFIGMYESTPDQVVRAPGRVNLIGEHIDYSMFDVCPMAIELAVYMAVGMADGEGITVANAESEKYPVHQLPSDPWVPVGRGSDHRWSGYFHCGYKGVFEYAKEEKLLPSDVLARGLPGLRVMVKGDVPAGGGLSSSAAMVVASALATARMLGLSLTPQQLALLAIRGERHIGVLSGGMDQAASVMSKQGSALHISFTPNLMAESVRLPSGYAFVICDSGVKAEKAVSALHHYNKRVVECSLAAALLAKSLGRTDADRVSYSLRDISLLNAVPEKDAAYQKADAGLSPSLLREAAELSRQSLGCGPDGVYSMERLRSELGTDPANLFPSKAAALAVLDANTDFCIANRAVHVFEEAARVLEFIEVCNGHTLTDANRAQALGEIMNASHSSCADLYDCSCPELDRLVELARQEGALGSRLTGAGWGGACVSLVPEGLLQSFVNAMAREAKGIVFATAPGIGACAFTMRRLTAVAPEC